MAKAKKTPGMYVVAYEGDENELVDREVLSSLDSAIRYAKDLVTAELPNADAVIVYQLVPVRIVSPVPQEPMVEVIK